MTTTVQTYVTYDGVEYSFALGEIVFLPAPGVPGGDGMRAYPARIVHLAGPEESDGYAVTCSYLDARGERFERRSTVRHVYRDIQSAHDAQINADNAISRSIDKVRARGGRWD